MRVLDENQSDAEVDSCVRCLEMSCLYYLNDLIEDHEDIRRLPDYKLELLRDNISDKYFPVIQKYRKAIKENNFTNFNSGSYNTLMSAFYLLGTIGKEEEVFQTLQGEFDDELFGEE